MTIHYADSRFTAGRHSPASRTFFAYGFLLRAGIVALSVVAIALSMLANGEASAPAAIATAIVAGVVAALAWRKAWALIDRAEGSDSSKTATPSAQPRRPSLDARVESAVAR